ncbi:MAG: hypothetical protein ACR2GX_00470 [Candidatus Dormibacteria bacterium]
MRSLISPRSRPNRTTRRWLALLLLPVVAMGVQVAWSVQSRGIAACAMDDPRCPNFNPQAGGICGISSSSPSGGQLANGRPCGGGSPAAAAGPGAAPQPPPPPPPPLPPPPPPNFNFVFQPPAPGTLHTDPPSVFLVFNDACAEIQGYQVPTSGTAHPNGGPYGPFPGDAPPGPFPTTIDITYTVEPADAFTYKWGVDTTQSGASDPAAQCGKTATRNNYHMYTRVSGNGPGADNGGPASGETVTAHQSFRLTAKARRCAAATGCSGTVNILINGSPTSVLNWNWSSGPHLVEQIEGIAVG